MMSASGNTNMGVLARGAATLLLAVGMTVAAGCSAAPAPTLPPAAATPTTTATAAPVPASSPTARPSPAPSATALPVLRVAVDAANPPWLFTNTQGALAGIDLELLTAVAAEMGMRLELANTAPHLFAAELAAKRADLAAGGLPAGAAAGQAVVYSRPYMTVPLAIVVRSADVPSGTAALSGKSAGAQIGSPAVAAASAAGSKVRAYDDLSIALTALSRGEVQAVVGDGARVSAALRAQPGLGLRAAGTLGNGQPVALAVARENAALLARVNAALDALDKRGVLPQLQQRWLQ